jgi:integrase
VASVPSPGAENQGESAQSVSPCLSARTSLGGIDVNPIDLVRQRGGRRSIPRVLSVHDIRLVLEQLAEPYRTMVLVAACLGLRASEIVGLQWGDLNLEDLTLLVRAKRSSRPSRRHENRSLTVSFASRFPSSRCFEGTLASQHAPRKVGLDIR